MRHRRLDTGVSPQAWDRQLRTAVVAAVILAAVLGIARLVRGEEPDRPAVDAGWFPRREVRERGWPSSAKTEAAEYRAEIQRLRDQVRSLREEVARLKREVADQETVGKDFTLRWLRSQAVLCMMRDSPAVAELVRSQRFRDNFTADWYWPEKAYQALGGRWFAQRMVATGAAGKELLDHLKQ